MEKNKSIFMQFNNYWNDNTLFILFSYRRIEMPIKCY